MSWNLLQGGDGHKFHIANEAQIAAASDSSLSKISHTIIIGTTAEDPSIFATPAVE